MNNDVRRLSTTQPSLQVDQKGPATVTSGKITFEEARAVGQELNDWFSRELAAPRLDLRQDSNNVRNEILQAILIGDTRVKSQYDDVTGELSIMLDKRGLTFEGPGYCPIRPKMPGGDSTPVALQFSHDVSFVMDVWVDDAKDAREMIERSAARRQIVNAVLAGRTDIPIAYDGPIPDLQGFRINVSGPTAKPVEQPVQNQWEAVPGLEQRVNPVANIQQAITKLRADLSTEGSRLKFRHECGALFKQIDELKGGPDSEKLLLMMRAKIREQTTVPLTFLAEVSAVTLTKGSEGAYMQRVNASLPAAARNIQRSSMPLADKLKAYSTLLSEAKDLAESQKDPEFKIDLLIAVSSTFKEMVFPVVTETLVKAGINETSIKQELQTLKMSLDAIDRSLVVG